MSSPSLDFADIPGVRVPRQERSRERLERVLDAAEELVREGGVSAMSIGAVSERAQTSVGALYSRFDDKRALLHAVHVRFIARTAASVAAAAAPERWEGRTLAEVVDGIVPLAVLAIRGNAGLIRAFMLASLEDPVMRERAELATRQGMAAVIGLLAERRAEIADRDPEAAADFAMRLAAATAQHSLIFAQPTPRAYDDEELAQRLASAVKRYLVSTA